MAISVLNVRDVRNGSSFPLNNYEEPYGTVEDGVFLHPRALKSQASDNLVKAVFFSFKRLEEILTMFPSDMSLKEFSHLSHSSPGRHLIINISSKKQVVVRDSRMKEKVMVAINAARAARRQSEVRWPEARCLRVIYILGT